MVVNLRYSIFKELIYFVLFSFLRAFILFQCKYTPFLLKRLYGENIHHKVKNNMSESLQTEVV